MPQRPATPRATRNSRGLRSTTPTEKQKRTSRSRASSVASDDSNTSAATRRSLRVSNTPTRHIQLSPPRRRARKNRSRESSVESDDHVRPPSTPYPRGQAARSPSVESETNTAEPQTDGQSTPPVVRVPEIQQLPLPPVPATTVVPTIVAVSEAVTQLPPSTPQPARPSNLLGRFRETAHLTPITEVSEESPVTARRLPFTPLNSPIVEEPPFTGSTFPPTPVNYPNFEESPVAAPALPSTPLNYPNFEDNPFPSSSPFPPTPLNFNPYAASPLPPPPLNFQATYESAPQQFSNHAGLGPDITTAVEEAYAPTESAAPAFYAPEPIVIDLTETEEIARGPAAPEPIAIDLTGTEEFANEPAAPAPLVIDLTTTEAHVAEPSPSAATHRTSSVVEQPTQAVASYPGNYRPAFAETVSDGASDYSVAHRPLTAAAGPVTPVRSPRTPIQQSAGSRGLHTVGIGLKLRPVEPSCFPTPEPYHTKVSDDELQAYIDVDIKGAVLRKEPDDLPTGPDPTWISARTERDRKCYREKLRSDLGKLCDEWEESPRSCADPYHSVVLGEQPGETTQKYVSLKKEEGHAFGERLIKAIAEEHVQRGCECPLPTVHPNQEAAEAGKGTFRFFRQTTPSGSIRIRVFMRKGDWNWHCYCHNEPLSDFALWVRQAEKKQIAYEAGEQLQQQLLAEFAGREERFDREAQEQLRIEFEKHTERQSRKRKAADSELELSEASTLRILEGPCQPGEGAKRRRLALLAAKLTPSVSLARLARVRAIRSRAQRLLRSAVLADTARFMGGGLSTVSAATMATSVKHFFSRVSAQLSTAWSPRPLQTAVEDRIQDVPRGLKVKRFKRVAYSDITTQEAREAWEAGADPDKPSPFDDLAWFEWTDNRTKFVGQEALEIFRRMAQTTLNDIEWNRYRPRMKLGVAIDQPFESEYELRAEHEELVDDIKFRRIEPRLGNKWNKQLSLNLHDWALRHFDLENYTDLSDYHRDRALEKFTRGAESLVSWIRKLYFDQETWTKLKDAYGPKPPKHLRDFMTGEDRKTAFEASDFMTLFLAQDSTITNELKLAAKRLIIDLDALQLLDIPNSLVEYPGKYDHDILPGTFASGLMEEVPDEDIGMTFRQHIQGPDREPEQDHPARQQEKSEPQQDDSERWPKLPGDESDSDESEQHHLVPSRGILKESHVFPFPRSPMPGDKPKQRTIDFHPELSTFFRSPFRRKSPQHQGRKPVQGSRVSKARRSTVPDKTRELFKQWSQDLQSRSSSRGVQAYLPDGRPEDQTMEEAGGWRQEWNLALGRVKRVVPPTKYEQFLEETREELFEEGFVMGGKTSKTLPVYGGQVAERSAPSYEEQASAMDLEASPAKSHFRPGAKPATPKKHRPEFKPAATPVKTLEQIELEREAIFLGKEIVNGELVKPATSGPDLVSGFGELEISNQKSDDLEVRRQLLKERAEHLRRQLARQAAEKEARRLEDERRRLEEERQKREKEAEREAEEERRREQERARREAAAAAKRREEEAANLRRSLGLRRPNELVIADLSDDWRTKVNQARRLPPTQAFATGPDGTDLTSRDLNEKLLPQTAWLNDNVIIGSIQHIANFANQRAGATNDNPKVAAFTSYFWPRLDSHGPGSCARLMRRAGVKKETFLNIETILVPICSGAHWTLGVVRPQQKAVLHMDSLRGGRGDPRVTNKLMEWVKVTLGDLFEEDQWHAVNLDGPTQTNGYDCGMFSILNSLCMALGLDPKESYRPNQLTSARSWIAGVLVNKGFDGDFSLDRL